MNEREKCVLGGGIPALIRARMALKEKEWRTGQECLNKKSTKTEDKKTQANDSEQEGV